MDQMISAEEDAGVGRGSDLVGGGCRLAQGYLTSSDRWALHLHLTKTVAWGLLLHKCHFICGVHSWQKVWAS